MNSCKAPPIPYATHETSIQLDSLVTQMHMWVQGRLYMARAHVRGQPNRLSFRLTGAVEPCLNNNVTILQCYKIAML